MCGARPQVIQDLHEECGKHGAITRVFVPRPPNPSFLAASVFGTGNYGKVLVRTVASHVGSSFVFVGILLSKDTQILQLLP